MTADFRIGVDVMTTETTCLSSIWKTDDADQRISMISMAEVRIIRNLILAEVAYYDGMRLRLTLSTIRPMIAMPFHPSNTYTIEELNANLMDILDDV